MKKLFLSFAVVGSFLLYSTYIKRGDLIITPVIIPKSQMLSPESGGNTTEGFDNIQNPVNPSIPATNLSVHPTSTPIVIKQTPTPVTTPKGQFRDGTYTGSVADAYYGNIQVAATFQGGKLTDVSFLQYPNDRDRSIRINQYAMPILRQETITAQSSQVDIVSGATDTSQAFIESMSSVFSQAKNV